MIETGALRGRPPRDHRRTLDAVFWYRPHRRTRVTDGAEFGQHAPIVQHQCWHLCPGIECLEPVSRSGLTPRRPFSTAADATDSQTVLFNAGQGGETMTADSPVRFTDSVETRKDDEQDTIEKLNATFDKILETTANDYGHAVRSVHAKAHGILEGTLTVHPDLPPELAQGMFSKPGEHKVYMRLSTNAGDILPDAISLPRGLALKVLDVEGERLPCAEGRTQNFVMVNGPVFQAKTADKFLGNLKMLAGTTDKLEGTKKTMSTVLRGINTALEAVGIESPKVQSLGGAPNVDPLAETYYSVTRRWCTDRLKPFQ